MGDAPISAIKKLTILYSNDLHGNFLAKEIVQFCSPTLALKKTSCSGSCLGVDIIIGGHSHTFLEEPENVNGILIAQAGTGTDQIGRLIRKSIRI